MNRSVVGSGGAIILGLCALLALALDSTPAAAQQGVTTGAISGRVVDSQGAPLADATVFVRNVETGRGRQVQTSDDGRFAAGFLAPGRYTVRAESPPLAGVEQGPFEVSLGEQKVVSLTLAPVELEAVAVNVVADQVDATQGGVVELVDEEQIESLPTLGRDFTDFINLSGLVSPTPEVTTGGQFSLGGGRTSATNVQIDGVDANNAFFGENRGSSRIPFTFSLESIKEFQIITNGFDIEYGNYTGGIINAVTKGGTNDFKGSAFYFGRDEALTADGFDGEPPKDFKSHQFGFRAGGPIIRDKAHFFVSLDGQQKNQPIFAIVPGVWPGSADSLARFEDILQRVYGVSQEEIRQNIGTFEETEDELAIFGRFDWQIADRHNLTLRHNYSDFEQLNDRVSSEEARTHGGRFEDTANSFAAELTSVLGSRSQVFNTLRFQAASEDRPRPGNNSLPEVDVRIDQAAPAVEYFGDGIVFRNRLQESKYQVVDNLTWQLGEGGRHTLKLGTNDVWTNIENLFWLNGNGEYRFTSLANFEARRPSQYTRNLRADLVAPSAAFDIAEYAVYGQDEWQVNDHLLVSAGLRYDTNIFETKADQPPDTFRVGLESAFGLNAATVPEDRNNISPRVAFTYDIRGDEQAVVRGGAGLLYGRLPFVLHGNVLQTSPPLLFLFCSSTTAPVPDYALFGQAPDGANNPSQCATGTAAGGRPEFSIWDEDMENPEAWKVNLGYEQVVGDGWRVSLDGLYGRTQKNFNVINVNLRDEQFRTAVDDRPVFVPNTKFSGTISSSEVIKNPQFQSIYLNESTAESEAWSLTLKGGKAWEAADLRLDGSYTYNNVYDNSSFFCCTSNEGYRTKPTAGNPNFIGDPGDEDAGTWGPADFERRHVVIVSGTWQGPWGVDVSGIWRSQSGTPFSLTVEGDVNGDGERFNDRAPVFEDLQFKDATEAAQWAALLESGSFTVTNADGSETFVDGGDAAECLQEELGRIARRNSCNNPWFHSLDLHLAKAFGFGGGHEIEVIADIFNVLNGLSDDWGKFVFVDGNEPLEKSSYDPVTNKVVYSVKDNFGDEQGVGFKPLQFQGQFGLRYRF
ncbi:MAG: TonB-dependent receptor domain-containing protein [Gemmatimonadota bacterium]